MELLVSAPHAQKLCFRLTCAHGEIDSDRACWTGTFVIKNIIHTVANQDGYDDAEQGERVVTDLQTQKPTTLATCGWLCRFGEACPTNTLAPSGCSPFTLLLPMETCPRAWTKSARSCAPEEVVGRGKSARRGRIETRRGLADRCP